MAPKLPLPEKKQALRAQIIAEETTVSSSSEFFPTSILSDFVLTLTVVILIHQTGAFSFNIDGAKVYAAFVNADFPSLSKILLGAKPEAHVDLNVLPVVIFFGLLALATLAGVFRFTGIKLFKPFSEIAIQLAGLVGLPLLAFYFANIEFNLISGYTLEHVLLAIIGLSLLKDIGVAYLGRKVYSTLLGLPVYHVLGYVAYQLFLNGDELSAITLVAGLVLIASAEFLEGIGSQSFLFLFKGYDVIHFFLAIGSVSVWFAFSRLRNDDSFLYIQLSHYADLLKEEISKLLAK